METFEISINMEGITEQLQVYPEDQPGEETTYKIYNDGDYLGTVWPECVDEGLCWYSSDEIPEDTLMKIGEAIEKIDR